MASRKLVFATATSITCTLDSLSGTPGTARECTAIDNSTNLYLDALLYLGITVANTTPGSDKIINIYAYGSHDGTNYTDNATGTDAAVTLRSPTNLLLIGQIATPTQNILYKWTGSVAWVFGGVLPKKWGFVVENRSNMAFAASGNTKEYTGVYESIA